MFGQPKSVKYLRTCICDHVQFTAVITKDAVVYRGRSLNALTSSVICLKNTTCIFLV